MSAVSLPVHHEAHGDQGMSARQFINTYVFSLDHKIIGLQFLFSTLLWFLVGGLLYAVSSMAGVPYTFAEALAAARSLVAAAT